MKRKISITLDDDLLKALDRGGYAERSRSELIEEAVAAYVVRHEKAAREARERKRLDRLADALNAEVEDVLAFQDAE